MNRFLLTLAVLSLMTFGVSAQEHLSFKGIPIEGSLTSFCKKLQSKGMTKIESDNSGMMLSGIFAGQQATIAVGATDDGKNVHYVVVMFDPSDKWRNLVNTYNHYKAMYIHKYGQPTENHENNPSTSDSNTMLMYELSQGTVKYESIWNVTGGIIALSIQNLDTYGRGAVGIFYKDNLSSKLKTQNDLNDI